MTMSPTRFSEVVLRTLPAASQDASRSMSCYDVLVYASQPLSIFSDSRRGRSNLDRERPQDLLGMPLLAVERLEVHWRRYEEYLADFLEGEKAAFQMRSKLLGALSPGLEALFSGHSINDRPTRIRWLNDTPELEDLPWDLLAQAERGQHSSNDLSQRVSFVRGMPPPVLLPPTIIPQGQPPRVGLIGDLDTIPPSLRAAWGDFIILSGPPRMALQRAADEKVEVLHIVADGQTSLGYEGLLSFSQSDSESLFGPSRLVRESERSIAPSELSAWLRGTRIALVCLSPSNRESNPQSLCVGGHFVPSVYRAFAYLGTSRQPLPSFIAPLGPIEEWHVARFWREFHAGLRETLNVEEAMIRAQSHGAVPMALFLRYPHGQLFRQMAPEERHEGPDPSQLGAQLQSSHEIIDQLKRLEKMYGAIPQNVARFLDAEQSRQVRINRSLSRWISPEDGQ